MLCVPDCKILHEIVGDKWKMRRRLLTPAFHFTILNVFIHVFNKQSRIMCQLFQENSAAEFDIIPYITNCTLDIICGKYNLGFGNNFLIVNLMIKFVLIKYQRGFDGCGNSRANSGI